MRVEVIDRTIIGVGDERGVGSTSKLFQILIRQCGLLKDSITHRKFIVSVKLLHTFEHFDGDGAPYQLLRNFFPAPWGHFLEIRKLSQQVSTFSGGKVEAHLLKQYN